MNAKKLVSLRTEGGRPDNSPTRSGPTGPAWGRRLLGLSATTGLLALGLSALGQWPGDARSAGLQYIVPDRACSFNAVGNYVTDGFVNLKEAANPADLGNWEPYTGVVGDSTFLVGFNTYANDGTFANQDFVVAKQPVFGGPPRLDYQFSDDHGHPFKGQINLSRVNGNPERVAGDKRPGANTFITDAEVSIGQLPPFEVVRRWANNNIYQGDNRYAAQQLFTLDPWLDQQPVADAWDYVYGPVRSTAVPFGAPQCSRTGGRCDFLDNGNIVVMIDDLTGIVNPGVESTVFAIIEPNGKIVKGPTLVDPRNIWDNMCAFQGGFCIRVYDSIYFFDDWGNLISSNDLAVANADLITTWGFANGPYFGYYIDRGDSGRVASDIHSRYVYFADGVNAYNASGTYLNPCMMAIWNGQTGKFIANAMVSSDYNPAYTDVDRTAVAADANDDVCVVYDGIADYNVPNYGYLQAIARVLHFDGRKVQPLTPSFLAFVNSDNRDTVRKYGVQGFFTDTPTVTMTTEAICISAKGWINSTNNPAGGPDTFSLGGSLPFNWGAPQSNTGLTDFYTVIGMPASGH